MQITKNKKELIIKIPLTQKRFSSFNDSEWEGENIIGIIDKDCSLSYRINMDYKGKEDQFTVPFLIYKYGDSFGVNEDDKKEFRELCKNLDIEVQEFSLCARCYEPLYGTHTIDKKGNQICITFNGKKCKKLL